MTGIGIAPVAGESLFESLLSTFPPEILTLRKVSRGTTLYTKPIQRNCGGLKALVAKGLYSVVRGGEGGGGGRSE